jgi:hypothetical protein
VSPSTLAGVLVGALSASLALWLVLMPAPAPRAAAAGPGPPPPPPGAPLAAALTTASGSWAVVAMGQPGAPLNTFWEIFFEAPGAKTWKLVTPTGVADNGGLTLAASDDGSATVGFEPSQLLHYSPLARSTDAGSTWTPGLVPASLVDDPDALAVAGGSGPALALVRHGTGQVLASAGSLLRWAPLPGGRSLTGAAAARCGVAGLNAVAWLAPAAPLLGTGCGRGAGQVGVFARSGTAWRLIGPVLTGSLAGSATRVLRLHASDSTDPTDPTTALVAATAAGRTDVLGLWRPATGGWSVSPALGVGRTQRVLATAVGVNGALLVHLGRGGRPGALDVTGGPGQGWIPLASPPAGTVTVALTGDGTVDAFSVRGSRLRIFSAAAAPGNRWTLTQSMNVPIDYGSS